MIVIRYFVALAFRRTATITPTTSTECNLQNKKNHLATIGKKNLHTQSEMKQKMKKTNRQNHFVGTKVIKTRFLC